MLIVSVVRQHERRMAAVRSVVEPFFRCQHNRLCRKQTRCVASSNRPATYKVLRSPKKLGEESYANLVKILADHISPIPSEIVQRFKFNSRSRKPGDSVATYVAEFCAIAEFCNTRGYVEGQDCVWYQRQCYTKMPAS